MARKLLQNQISLTEMPHGNIVLLEMMLNNDLIKNT